MPARGACRAARARQRRSLLHVEARPSQQSEEQYVNHLVNVFRTFSKPNGRKKLFEIGDELQLAIADIHLIGTPEEIALTQRFVDDLRTEPEAEMDELLNLLRASLRNELGLPPIDGAIHRVRPVDPKSEDARSLRGK